MLTGRYYLLQFFSAKILREIEKFSSNFIMTSTCQYTSSNVRSFSLSPFIVDCKQVSSLFSEENDRMSVAVLMSKAAIMDTIFYVQYFEKPLHCRNEAM